MIESHLKQIGTENDNSKFRGLVANDLNNASKMVNDVSNKIEDYKR